MMTHSKNTRKLCSWSSSIKKNTNKNVLIANTHLFWNPDFEYVKYGQISKIINHVSKNYPGIPLILCGDFNSTPSSNVMKYVYKKAPEITNSIKGDFQKNKKYLELFHNEFAHKMELRSAYDVYKVSKVTDYEDYADNHPDFTTYTHEFIGTLDYVIYSKNNLEVTELLKCPTHDTEVKALKLPNARYPSDHFKVGARFKFI